MLSIVVYATVGPYEFIVDKTIRFDSTDLDLDLL